MNDTLTEDAKQTVICPPELESRCKGYVEARGLGGLITIEANRLGGRAIMLLRRQ